MPEHVTSAGLVPVSKDKVVWRLAAFASLVSVASFYYFSHKGVVLAYKDAISHMEIARRVIDSPTTGFGQLGGVWLPLPHLLMLPFIWNDQLYYAGLAGSLISMASYVVTSVLLYKIVLSLTGKRLPAVVSALVFMSNPGVLYMQSTPMTELLLFACMVGMVYAVQRWIQTDNYTYLLAAGVAAFLGTLTRYEAWALLLALTAVAVLAAWRKGYARVKIEGTVLAFLFVAGAGIVAWMGWNLLIFGNALNFQNGKYAKPSLWVGSGDITIGHWSLALKTYWFAVVDNISLPGLALLLLGLLVMLLWEPFSLQILPTLSLLSLFPFFVVALEKGQRPLHVTQLTGDLYNVRFGLLMILPAAILSGYSVRAFQNPSPLRGFTVIALAAAVAATSVPQLLNIDRIATVHEPLRWQHSTTDTGVGAANFMKKHYDNGKILAQFFGSEDVLFDARIALANNVYEGSYKQWEPDIAAPAEHHIRWIVVRYKDRGDELNVRLNRTKLKQFYSEVYHNGQFSIFRRT